MTCCKYIQHVYPDTNRFQCQLPTYSYYVYMYGLLVTCTIQYTLVWPLAIWLDIGDPSDSTRICTNMFSRFAPSVRSWPRDPLLTDVRDELGRSTRFSCSKTVKLGPSRHGLGRNITWGSNWGGELMSPRVG